MADQTTLLLLLLPLLLTRSFALTTASSAIAPRTTIAAPPHPTTLNITHIALVTINARAASSLARPPRTPKLHMRGAPAAGAREGEGDRERDR